MEVVRAVILDVACGVPAWIVGVVVSMVEVVHVAVGVAAAAVAPAPPEG